MNKNVLAVLAVVVAGLTGWLVVSIMSVPPAQSETTVVEVPVSTTGVQTTSPSDGTSTASVEVGATEEEKAEATVEVVPE